MIESPQPFITNSEFATLKGDGIGRITLNINAGDSIPANSSRTWSSTADIGTINASLRVQMETSRYPDQWTVGTSRSIDIPIPTGVENAIASIQRITPTTLRLYLVHYNFSPNPVSITTSQTITADVATFLSPFV